MGYFQSCSDNSKFTLWCFYTCACCADVVLRGIECKNTIKKWEIGGWCELFNRVQNTLQCHAQTNTPSTSLHIAGQSSVMCFYVSYVSTPLIVFIWDGEGERNRAKPTRDAHKIQVWVENNEPAECKKTVQNKSSCEINVDLLASQLFHWLWPLRLKFRSLSLFCLQLFVPPEHISMLPGSPYIPPLILLISSKPKQQMLKCRSVFPPPVNSQNSGGKKKRKHIWFLKFLYLYFPHKKPPTPRYGCNNEDAV